MKIVYILVFMNLLFATSTTAQTTDVEAEARIKAKVEEMGLKFSVTDTGNFKFVFGLKQDRSQVVFIRKSSSPFNGIEYIRVFTPTLRYTTSDQIPKQVLLDLMSKNGIYKLGWFELVTDQAASVIYLSHKISINATAVNLYALLKEIAEDADKLEQQYATKDDL